MNIHLSDWVAWSERVTLGTEPGVYLIAKSRETIYIEKTWGSDGVRGRLAAFHRSATNGQKGHAGGVTYFEKFGAIEPDDITVRIHVPIIIRQSVLYPYVSYAERRLIWEHVEQHGSLPQCNLE